MSASNPSIPSGGLLLNYPLDPVEEGDDCAHDPNYFFPLADWHLKDMAKHRVIDAVAATLYVLGLRHRSSVRRNPPKTRTAPALTKDNWFVNAEQVYLALDEAKRRGDARYKSGFLARIYACPALVFITDEYYFPVLDLNTPKPFAGLHRLVVEEGVGLPKTVGKLGKLLASAERKQAKGQVFLKGIAAKEQLEFERLSLDTVRKPSCLAYTRQYVKVWPPAGSTQEPELNPDKVARQEKAKWVLGSWDVSDEYAYLIAASHTPEN